MPSASKSLMKPVNFNGQKMSTVDALNVLAALNPSMALTTSEAAIFLRASVSTLERWRTAGTGPEYSQALVPGAKGTNQAITYKKQALIDWQEQNTVSSSKMAATLKGQMAFATIFDLAEVQAYYLDGDGNVESMVEDNMLGTVVERIGRWDIAWMPATEAAARTWLDLDKHREFAAQVGQVLKNALRASEEGVESTDIRISSMQGSDAPEQEPQVKTSTRNSRTI